MVPSRQQQCFDLHQSHLMAMSMCGTVSCSASTCKSHHITPRQLQCHHITCSVSTCKRHISSAATAAPARGRSHLVSQSASTCRSHHITSRQSHGLSQLQCIDQNQSHHASCNASTCTNHIPSAAPQSHHDSCNSCTYKSHH